MKFKSNENLLKIKQVALMASLVIFVSSMCGCAKATEYKSEHESSSIKISSLDDIFTLPKLEKGMTPDQIAKYFKDFCYYPSEYDGERIEEYEAVVPLEFDESFAESIPYFSNEITFYFNADKELITAKSETSLDVEDSLMDENTGDPSTDYVRAMSNLRMYELFDEDRAKWITTKNTLIDYCESNGYQYKNDNESAHIKRDNDGDNYFIHMK